MRPILNVVGISKMMELADYNYRPPPGGPPGGGGVGRAYALAVCIKSGIAPEPRVVGGGLRTGCSGYQERVAQNRHLLYYWSYCCEVIYIHYDISRA